MPEKFPKVQRGVFVLPTRREREEGPALGLSPDAGALLLSLVQRMGALESQVRGERLTALSAEARLEVVVLDNEEATDRIRELEQQVRDINRIREPAFAIINLVNSEGDDFIAKGPRFTKLLNLTQSLKASFP